MKYRVNFGNGQVSERFSSWDAAQAHIDSFDLYREFAFVQKLMDGDWWAL